MKTEPKPRMHACSIESLKAQDYGCLPKKDTCTCSGVESVQSSNILNPSEHSEDFQHPSLFSDDYFLYHHSCALSKDIKYMYVLFGVLFWALW